MVVKETTADGWDTQGTMFIRCDNNEASQGVESYLDGPLARSESDLPDGPLLRFNAYRKAWDNCLSRIKELVHTLHNPAIEAVLRSVQAAYRDSGEDAFLPSSELATLIVSSSDRASLHEALAEISSRLCEDYDVDSQNEMQEDWTPAPRISQVSGLDCPNITATMRTLISNFISHPGDNMLPAKIKSSSSPAAYDVDLLKAWYQRFTEKYNFKRPALVVLIHDLYAIDSGILRDILEIFSLHVPDLPLVFVLGSSDPELLHSVLPRSTLACLRIDRYVLPWNIKTLEHVIRETFFSQIFAPDVMLGPVGFEMIFQEFKRHNATLDALLSTLQLLHIQHFYNPASIIVDPASDAMLFAVQNDPPEDWVPFFKLLRRYCISSTLADAPDSADVSEWPTITPHKAIHTIIGSRQTFRAQMNRMKLAVRIIEVVLAFGRGQGKKTPGIKFDRLGLGALRGSVGTDEILAVLSIIKQSSSNEVTALLEELYYLLHNLPSSVRNGCADLKSKVVLAKNDNKDKKKLTDFLEIFESYLTESLIPFDDVAGLDIWWTGELDIPHSPLNPNPHLSIVTSLLDPQGYLGWKAPTNPLVQRDLSSLPDACILFRRYVESGKMINIYDWYDSFSVALESETLEQSDGAMDVEESPSKGKGHRKAQIDLKGKQPEDSGDEEVRATRTREIQARFMRSMHELEFVGFLKHTGRKADHIMKTAFDVLD